MSLDISKSIEVIETLENYFAKKRPKPPNKIQLDFSYEIQDQSVILYEIRRTLEDPDNFYKIPYGKATFISEDNHWNVYFAQPDNQWRLFGPRPFVKEFKDFLKTFDATDLSEFSND